MSDVTFILSQIEAGDPSKAEDLLPLVYDELRRLATARMASERPDHTLQATALVHEAYVRLVAVQKAQHWDSRGHFFAAAAEAMRRILIDSAHRRGTQKRGGDRIRVDDGDLDVAATSSMDPDLLLDLDEGIADLEQEDADAANLMKLRLFAGLSVGEAGKLLGMSRSTAYENWTFARSWFAVHHRQ